MTEVKLPRVVTTSEHGYEAIRASRRQGEIERLRRGAFVTPRRDVERWERDRELHLARCVAVNKKLSGLYAFSHASAAALFGWDGPVDPDRVEIVQVPKPSSTRQHDIRRHARPTLTDGDIVEVAGMPVLRELPTVIDCARGMTPMNALVTVDSALKHLADVDKFRREQSLERQAALLQELDERLKEIGPGRHVIRAREVLRYANGLSGSPRESRLRWLALAVGLPEPIVEWEQLIDGDRYFSDLAWLRDADDWTARAITFEYDGSGKYGADVPAALRTIAAEKDRQDVIASSDVVVHRVMKGRMRDHSAAARWMLSKFPSSTLAALTPRSILEGPPVILRRPSARRCSTFGPR